jgi:hypothetical protein
MNEILKYIAEQDMHDNLYWNEDLQFYIMCNDLFYWACADAEPLTEETLPTLKQAVADSDNIWGGLLYCCRMRKQSPQEPYFKSIPEKFHSLFR